MSMSQTTWCRIRHLKDKYRLFGVNRLTFKRSYDVRSEKHYTTGNDSVVQKETKKSAADITPGFKFTPRKDLTGPIPTAYNPEHVESEWYDWWNSNGCFSPDHRKYENNEHSTKETRKFVMCLPPPNITGSLHLGHALGNSIQDALIRWHRMCGVKTLWLPGCDHAGIATQVVVEKQLHKERGLTRHDIGREKFIQHVWKWKDDKGGAINKQMKRLGLSLDWEREMFTLDSEPSYAVREAFIRLHDDGLIYRSQKLINWCCALKSTISDIEVEDLELQGKTLLSVPGYEKKVAFGLLTSVKYPVENSNEYITIATTRPETMLGDVAIAVHPDDSRYSHLHGNHVIHPLTGRRIPIICDQFVNREFGTGAVKITPAHDANDYDVGKKHDLPFVTILSEDGTLINVPQPFQGMLRFTAREKVLEVLGDKQLLPAVVDHKMVLPICSRSGDVIEPLLKDQWFVDSKQMAQQAIEVVKDGSLNLFPDYYEKQWYDWLENIRDWCISRQLWWGHQIPAYRVVHKHTTSEIGWFSGHTMDEAKLKACDQLGLSAEDITLIQDEDVLDTWFSSALIPFSAFGWPKMTDDFCRFYPTNMIETASDIMFFWVARMVMMGYKLTGELPFRQVIFHSVIRDSYGRKMSKSLGNVLDPMDVINGTSLQCLHERVSASNLSMEEIEKAKVAQTKEYPNGIPACGADALRFSLCSYNYTANYINIDVDQVITSRLFCNKIWQTFRFISSNLPKDFQAKPIQKDILSPTDFWLLSRLSATLQDCHIGFSTYSLFRATGALRQFWWHDFCDIYLEYSKTVLASDDEAAKESVEQLLHNTLVTCLRALSPFLPYLCEELYQRLTLGTGDAIASIMVEKYPQPEEWRNLQVEEEMVITRDTINELLSLRTELNLGKIRADVYIQCTNLDVSSALNNHLPILEKLSRSKQIIFSDPPAGCVSHHGNGYTLNLHIQGHIDCSQEQKRLSAQMIKLHKQLDKLSGRTDRARGVPEQIAQAAEEKIRVINDQLERLQAKMDILSNVQNDEDR